MWKAATNTKYKTEPLHVCFPGELCYMFAYKGHDEMNIYKFDGMEA